MLAEGTTWTALPHVWCVLCHGSEQAAAYGYNATIYMPEKRELPTKKMEKQGKEQTGSAAQG